MFSSLLVLFSNLSISFIDMLISLKSFCKSKCYYFSLKRMFCLIVCFHIWQIFKHIFLKFSDTLTKSKVIMIFAQIFHFKVFTSFFYMQVIGICNILHTYVATIFFFFRQWCFIKLFLKCYYLPLKVMYFSIVSFYIWSFDVSNDASL